MRVLQTLALPLGHDADCNRPAHGSCPHHRAGFDGYRVCAGSGHSARALRVLQSGRWDSNPRPSPWQGDVLPLYYARTYLDCLAESAESQNRTDDTAIFSRVLYQLSYLGRNTYLKRVDFTRRAGACQASALRRRWGTLLQPGGERPDHAAPTSESPVRPVHEPCLSLFLHA